MKKNNKWIGLILLMVVIGLGCTTSKITSSWKAENTMPQKYNKVMVLGLIREADRTVQINMENHLVNDLKELGYNAVSSFQEYGPKAFDNMEEDAAVAKLKGSGIDAVLTIVLLDKQKERKYYAGDIYYSPYGYYYNRFWGYRTTLYRRIYEPGYYITDTKYFWESNLYDMNTQKLIYSVQTQSFDPANSDNQAHHYGQLIIQDMAKNNVIRKVSEIPSKAF
jgi:hypothetical protein